MRPTLLLVSLLLAGCGSTSAPEPVAGGPAAEARARSVGNTSLPLRAGWTAVGFQCQRLTALSTPPSLAGAATFADGAYVTGPLEQAGVNGRKGYWLFSNAPGELTYAGDDDGRGDRTALQVGWNLINLPTPDPVPGSQLGVRRDGQSVPLASAVLPVFYQLAADGQQTPVDVTQGGTLAPGRPLWVYASATCELSWSAPLPVATSLEITPRDFTLPRYSARQLTATARLVDGSSLDVTREVSWTSSVPSAVGVGPTGLVTGLAAGSYRVTATLGNVSAVSSINVTDSTVPGPGPVTGPAATTTSLAVNATVAAPGQTVLFTATVAGGAGTPTGSVNFAVDGGAPTAATLNGAGTATLSLNTLGLGSHSVVATYGGDTGHSTSTSSATSTSVERVFYIAVNNQVRRYLGNGTLLGPSPFVTLGLDPYTLKTDDDGNIWASVGSSVVRISPDGVQTDLITGVSNLRDLVVDHSGSLYYGNWISGQVYKANTDGTNIRTHLSVTPAMFGMEVDPSDNLYVCAYTNGEIRAFQPDGTALATFGTGGVVGGFNTNRWICRDAAGRLYVGSVNNDNIRSVNATGGDDQVPVSGFDSEEMVIGPSGNLYVCRTIAAVDQVTPAGVRTTFLTLSNLRALTYSR